MSVISILQDDYYSEDSSNVYYVLMRDDGSLYSKTLFLTEREAARSFRENSFGTYQDGLYHAQEMRVQKDV